MADNERVGNAEFDRKLIFERTNHTVTLAHALQASLNQTGSLRAEAQPVEKGAQYNEAAGSSDPEWLVSALLSLIVAVRYQGVNLSIDFMFKMHSRPSATLRGSPPARSSEFQG